MKARAENSTTLRYRQHRNIDIAKKSTAPKHRACQNIDRAKTLTLDKHRPRQAMDHIGLEWPKGSAKCN